MNIKNILFLNKFYTPKLLNVIYWVSAVLYTLTGLFLIIAGYDAEERLQGLFLLLFGVVIARISAELTIIPFRIYEKVSKIVDIMLAEEEKHSVDNTPQEAAKEIVK